MHRSLWARPVAVFLLMFVALPLWAPPPAAAARQHILHVASKEPDTLDPHATTLGQGMALVRFLYRGLTRFAIRDGKVTTEAVEPDLATSWSTSADGLEWIFTLRKGVQFHQGFGEMTAEDVKFSFERQRQHRKGMLFAQSLEVIKAIQVRDPYTVTFTLTSPDPLFLLRMVGFQHGYIVSKKAVEQLGERFGWQPVGAGPFAFAKHVPREKIILKAHETYYFSRPQIDEVHWFNVPEDAAKLAGLEQGTFDILHPEAVTADVEARLQRMGAVLDKRGPGAQERFYINVTQPPFDDLRVRQALLHAIDRQLIKDILYPGDLARLAVSPLPPGYFGHIPVDMPAYNPARARELLAVAGHPRGFTVPNYFISKSFFYPKVAALVQEQLKKVGIHLEIQLVDHVTYHANIRKNLNPFVLYGGTRLPDGDVWLHLFFSSREIPDPVTGNKGTNFAHYMGIDDLLAQGRLTREPQRRAQLYHEAQRRIVRDAVALPLVDVPFLQPRNPKRVQAPFASEYGESAVHSSYNYPEMLKIVGE